MGAAMIPMLALSACSDKGDDPAPGDNGDNPAASADGRFVFATTVQGSNATSYVLLTGERPEEGTISTVNNGLLNDGATQWVFHKDYLYALTYNQGNAGATRSYILGDNGEMKDRGTEYHISRFSSYGTCNDDIITMSTGEGPASLADAAGYKPMTLLVPYLEAPTTPLPDSTAWRISSATASTSLSREPNRAAAVSIAVPSRWA